MPKNIWIHTCLIIVGYIRSVFTSVVALFAQGSLPKNTKDYQLTHTLISVGPESFAREPRAIKIGRALFVPLLLISQLYDRKNLK